MTPPNAIPAHTQPDSSTHQAVAELLDLLNALPDQVNTTVIQTVPAGQAAGAATQTQTLAAQLRQVLSAQSQYQGG